MWPRPPPFQKNFLLLLPPSQQGSMKKMKEEAVVVFACEMHVSRRHPGRSIPSSPLVTYCLLLLMVEGEEKQRSQGFELEKDGGGGGMTSPGNDTQMTEDNGNSNQKQ